MGINEFMVILSLCVPVEGSDYCLWQHEVWEMNNEQDCRVMAGALGSTIDARLSVHCVAIRSGMSKGKVGDVK